MPDWTRSMKQTFEYYVVDPLSWEDKSEFVGVKSCTIERDCTSDTKGSASFTISEETKECYVRPYLVTVQNRITEKFPLGCFLVQTPTRKYDGRLYDIPVDGYTPLVELKESPPPLGYCIAKGLKIMDNAVDITAAHVRAPVVANKVSGMKLTDDFISNTDDTWFTFLTDLMAKANYEYALDEWGRILFAPKQETISQRYIWTYTDDNSSILLPEITVEQDIFDIPNVVEIVYSRSGHSYSTRVSNVDKNSPTSIAARGRQIVHRVTDADFGGEPSNDQLKEYGENLLESLSTLECTVTYKHAYCPVRVGDSVMLNYERAGITGVIAKVISQVIECKTGCTVTEKAVFRTKLWG